MLDQNLLRSFQKTPEFSAAKAQCDQQGSLNMEAAIVAAEDFDR
jgi:hypothetical protein